MLLLCCSQREHVHESLLSNDAADQQQSQGPVPDPFLFLLAVSNHQEEEWCKGSAAEGQADGD